MTELTEKALDKQKKADVIKIALGLQAENTALQKRIAELENQKPVAAKQKPQPKPAAHAPQYG